MVDKQKSPSAFRTIGEVSEELGVAQHVLRFWERKFKQINPVKRRGRRYYRPEDVALIQQIQTLLHEQGFTIKGVQKLLTEGRLKDVGEQADLFQLVSTTATASTEGRAVNEPKASTNSAKEKESDIAKQAIIDAAIKDLSQARKQLRSALAEDKAAVKEEA